MSTDDNLAAAFAGESQANRKYLAFAKKAEEEGFTQIARLFRAAAQAETVHALSHLRVMGQVKSTAENLQAAIDGEGYEFQQMYPQFLAEATAEKKMPAVGSFRNALAVERIHHSLYARALDTLRAGNDLPPERIFVCGVCGNTVPGQPPEVCPVCGSPRRMFSEVD
jgi:rubrerythrin